MKIHKLGWLATLAMLLTTSVSAQNSTQTIIKPNINYAAPSQYIIGGLNIDGIKGFDDDLLRNFSGLQVGQTITVPSSDSEVTQAIQRYWKQGLFSDVSIEADSIVENKIYLHIKLVSRPRISKITYTGIKKSEKEDIETRLGLKEGNQISPNMIDRAKYIIKNLFDEKGFKNATVEILQQDDLSENNKVFVEIRIDKHEKIKVKSILFTGVTHGKESKLKGAMKKTHETKLLNFFKSKKFIPEKYAEDKTFLIEKYNEWGYRDAYITSDSVITLDKKHVSIHININEGQKYYLRNVEWVGNTIYKTEALNATLKMQKGDIYNQKMLQKRLMEDEDAIGMQYYNNGYVFYQLNPVEVNVVGDSIDLELRISEGRQATFNHIRISGNTRVYEHVIRRELRTKPGDLFNRDAIVRSIREIASMGHFDAEKIDPDTKANEANGTVDLNYKLVSKTSDQVELSAGWGQTGVIGKVSLKFANFSIQDLFGKGNKRKGFLPQG
ncbi:MAG: POTRA domain-containing protein, partial [Bacteroidaceae bacterium]